MLGATEVCGVFRGDGLGSNIPNGHPPAWLHLNERSGICTNIPNCSLAAQLSEHIFAQCDKFINPKFYLIQMLGWLRFAVSGVAMYHLIHIFEVIVL